MTALSLLLAATIAAQSPNTATMIVAVVDQTGAVVPDASVSIVNTATGAARKSATGNDGNATFAALSLTGTYTVTVSKDGFGNEERKDIALRSGETATLKVNAARRLRGRGRHRLRHDRRRARRRADRPAPRQPADRRDADPRPQDHHAAAAQLRVPPGQRAPAISSSTPPTSSPAPARAAPRRSRSTARTTTKPGAGRR